MRILEQFYTSRAKNKSAHVAFNLGLLNEIEYAMRWLL